MKTDIKLSVLLNFALVGLAGIGVGYGIAEHNKIKNVAEKLQLTVDEVIANKDIDIPQSMIEDSIYKSVDTNVSRIVDRVSLEISSNAKNRIKRTVEQIIAEEASNIRGEVRDHTKELVMEINVDKIKQDMIDAASDRIISKLENDIDEWEREAKKEIDKETSRIIDKYSDNFETVSKIYKAIAVCDK